MPRSLRTTAAHREEKGGKGEEGGKKRQRVGLKYSHAGAVELHPELVLRPLPEVALEHDRARPTEHCS